MTMMVQLAVGVSIWLLQLSNAVTNSNGAASGLAKATSPIERLALPVLATVIVLSVEVPTVALPKSIAAVETVMFGVGTGMPSPLTLIVTVAVSGSSDGISKLSLRIPVAVGA